MNKQRLAISLMVAQGVLFAIETAMIHHIGSRVSVMLLAFLRGLAGLGVVAVLARSAGWAVIKTKQLPVQLLRGFVSVSYLWVMMYSFGRLPFADATAISYTQAAYIAIFATLILHERVSGLRWIAVIIGIIGAGLIIKPAFPDWNVAYLVALVGTSLNGLAFVLNRYLQRPDGDTELTTMFYINVVPVVCNLPVLVTESVPDAGLWLWLSGVLLFGPVGMYLGIVALRYANASALGPYTFLRLVIGIVGGIVVFREVPDVLSFLGAIIILASCLLTSSPMATLSQRAFAWQRAAR